MICNKFLCLDLRSGVLGYGIFSIVGILLAALLSFFFSLTDKEADKAADQTFEFGIHMVNLIVLTCLLYGAYQEKRSFLIPYLILHCILLSFLTILIFIYAFFQPSLLLLLIAIAFFWYVWLCVLSLYQTLDPRNPNYVPQQVIGPDTVVYIDEQPPPAYYENKGIDAV